MLESAISNKNAEHFKGVIMAEQDNAHDESMPNIRNPYKVTKSDLPLHCPTDEQSLWNSHPRVFLPIEATGKAKCPYCGTEYELADE